MVTAQASIGSQNFWSSQPRSIGIDRDQQRERLRLGAALDGGDLLDHQREGERRQHVEVLLDALQHRPHRQRSR